MWHGAAKEQGNGPDGQLTGTTNGGSHHRHGGALRRDGDHHPDQRNARAVLGPRHQPPDDRQAERRTSRRVRKESFVVLAIDRGVR
jgi:hypothetical protein